MKLAALLLLAAVAGPVGAAPVHIALKPAAAVSPNADGFFTLASVANVTGGGTALRARLAAVPIGRAPLSGESRRVTRGDLALKMRQAGCDPEKAAVLEGADAAEVRTEEPGTGSAGPLRSESAPGTADKPTSGSSVAERLSPSSRPALPVPGSLIHRGDAVSIVIQSGPLTITAPGVAREGGGAGQTIRVHREGVMTDLSVQVLDAQTVQLEI